MAEKRELLNNRLGLIMGDEVQPGITYQAIHDRYAQSTFGQYHAGQPLRYAQQYGYEREQMLGDLGDDVHPIRHMTHTDRAIAVPFIAAQIWDGGQQFTPDQIRGIRLAARVHDIGESEHPQIADSVGTIGDIHYELKRVSDSDQERLIRRYLFGLIYSDLPEELVDRVEGTIDTEGCLEGEAFNTIERIGYYQTAMRAGDIALMLAKREEVSTPRFSNLARLAIRVSDNHHNVLRSRGDLFPYAHTILQRKRRTYRRIHSELTGLVAES